MSAPAIPIDPSIIGSLGQHDSSAATAASLQDDSALADDSSDDDDDQVPAVVSAIPRRFSRRQSRGATGTEVRRLSSTRRDGSDSAGRTPRSGSFTTGGEGEPRQRKWSSGVDSLRPTNAFHIDSPVLANGGSTSPATGGGSGDLAEKSAAASASTTTLRKASQSQHDLGTTPTLLRRPSHSHGTSAVDGRSSIAEFEIQEPPSTDTPGRDTGSLKQLRAKLVLGTICVAQLLDNVSMTSVNMALPAIAEELNISQADQAWLISSYTLAFGSFLLLAGVLADRYGKKLLFIGGLIWLSIWVLACGFSQTLIQFCIFRALQGLGAACTVPSAVGILTSYFTGRERNLCLTIFGSAGALGFVVGLIYGGVLTDVLSWRWVFWLSTPIGAATAVAAYFVLPNPKPPANERRKSLDFIGAGTATTALILLTFVLTSGEASGWGTSYVVALLVVAVVLLAAFPLVEKYVKDPILPNYLWKQRGFAATWVCGFLVYCWWQTFVLYCTYISQNILHLSALRTSLQFIPLGVAGAITSWGVGIGVNYVKIRTLVLIGLALSFISVIPVAVMKVEHGFWGTVFPGTMIGVIGISIVYNAISVALMASVPPEARSLAGGLINTAFQIGAGCGVAIAAAVVTGVEDRLTGEHDAVLLSGYKAGLWTTAGFCGAAFILAAFGVKGGVVEVGQVH